jgi:hypothetical protein
MNSIRPGRTRQHRQFGYRLDKDDGTGPRSDILRETASGRQNLGMESDVARTSTFVATTLEPAIGRDWSVRAGQLDWSVEFTLEHIAAALSKYTLYLASRSREFVAVRIASWPNASQRERLDAIPSVGHALANVAAVTPPDVRAFHANGLLDAGGYAALGCLEALVHGSDVALGLGIDFDPPDDLVRPVVARLLPWLEPTWGTLLGHTRRQNADDSWAILTTPLAEWDGTIPGT